MTIERYRLAILDDYQGAAAPKFEHLSAKVAVTTFSDTIDPSTEEGLNALIQRLKSFDIISTMRERTPLSTKVVENLPSLKLVLTTGMQNTAIAMEALKSRGIPVVGARGLGKAAGTARPTSLDSTMEHCWALILGASRNLVRDHNGVTGGLWETSPAIGLRGKTLGLLGLGKLGARVASIGALGFGMKILAWSANLTQQAADEKAATFGLPAGTFKVASSKRELLQRADVLSVHYVLSERSRNMLSAEDLALLKPLAALVNTSRAALINEQALLEVLERGNIRIAALDVHYVEPLPESSVWRTTAWGQGGRSQVLLSPHMGYVEEGVLHRWYEDSAANLELWLKGGSLSTRLN